MPTRVVTPPAVEPVSTEEARTHLRVSANDEDDYIDALIVAARQKLEADTGRAFVTQTLELFADHFPVCTDNGQYRFDGDVRHHDHMPLRPKAQAVTSVTYVDTNGATQTWLAANYRADLKSEPGRITPAYNVLYPLTQCVTNAVTVTYTAGYGDAATDVPQAIRHAILLLVGHWYANREPVNIGNITTTLPMAVDALIAPYRVFT